MAAVRRPSVVRIRSDFDIVFLLDDRQIGAGCRLRSLLVQAVVFLPTFPGANDAQGDQDAGSQEPDDAGVQDYDKQVVGVQVRRHVALIWTEIWPN